jgi:hypothetical protein
MTKLQEGKIQEDKVSGRFSKVKFQEGKASR